MSSAHRPPLAWWLEKLSLRDIPGKKDLFTQCPAHNDNGPSLHITKKGATDCVVHCFAGCSYEDIISAIESGVKVKARVASEKGQTKPGTELPPMTWWERYTNVPLQTWHALGTAEAGEYLAFTFENSPYVKGRLKGTKEFRWTPKGGNPPPLWPIPKKELIDGDTIWLTEGESDCGVLRHLGFPAFALTKGAQTKVPRSYLKGFKSLGVTKAICAFDSDPSGDEAYESIKKTFNGFIVHRLPIDDFTEPFSQEKDLRDLLCRMGDQNLKAQIQEALNSTPELESTNFPALTEILTEETEWIWQGMIPHHNVTLFRGDAKVGKSTFLFALFRAMREGGMLGNRKVKKGRIILISEETEHTLKPKAEIYGPLDNVRVGGSILPGRTKNFETTIREAIRQGKTFGANLLVVDTFTSFAGFESGEENDASAVFERLTLLSSFRNELSIILVHHNSKQGKTRGSSAIDAHVDGILSVTRGNGIHRNLESINRYESAKQVLSIDPKTGKETLVLVKKERPTEDGSLVNLVYDFISTHNNVSSEIILESMEGHSQKAVLTAVKMLVKGGKVTGDSSGYRIKESESSVR
jgi:hypothetical protein